MGVIPNRLAVLASSVRDLLLLFGAIAVRQMCGEVFPRWVVMFNQADFLLAAPGFDFLFASDCIADIGEVFEVDEAEELVSSGEAGD